MEDDFFWVVDGELFSGPYNRAGLDFYIERKNLNNPKVSWVELPGLGVDYIDLDLRYHVYDFHSTITYSTDSEDELLGWFKEGIVKEGSKVYSHELRHINGWKVERILNLNLKITPTIHDLVKSREGCSLTIISGDNNVGKSYVLKGIQLILGDKANILLAGRIKPIGNIPEYKDDHSKEKQQYFKNFLNSHYNPNSNVDELNNQIERIFSGLKDKDQDKLIELLSKIIEDKFSIERIDNERRFSPWVIKVNDKPVSIASTGTRLSIILLSALFSQDYKHILIDEPEIGLSPKSQKRLAEILLNEKKRKTYFPNIDSIWLTTHSHLFLDRGSIKNNYVVKKEMDSIVINPINSMSEFHNLQFDMLGLDLDSFFLPNALILVEGESDLIYLRKLFNVFLPEQKINVIKASGDGGMLEKLNTLGTTLGNLESNPYRNTLFVVLDQQHDVKVSRIVRMGVLEENIFEWTQNGIEYYYPSELITALFKCEFEDYEKALANSSTFIKINGITFNKTKLAEEVSANITRGTVFNDEFNNFIHRVKKKLLA
jgi:predicted ATPase